MENQNLESAEGAAPGKKRKLKKIIVLFLALVMLCGAGAGGFYFWRLKSAQTAEEGEEASESSGEKSKKSKSKKGEEEKSNDAEDEESASETADGEPDSEEKNVKHILELQPFIVNLADEDQARYLRLTVSLGLGGEAKESEKPDLIFTTRARNAILAVLSIKKSGDILSGEGKNKLRKELLEAAQAVSGDAEVSAVYITEFIVQL